MIGTGRVPARALLAVTRYRYALMFASWVVSGLWSAAGEGQLTLSAVSIVVLTSAGVGLFRRAPGIALAVVWLAGTVQLVSATGFLAAQLGVLVVAFGCARWGKPVTIWLSGASLPTGALLGELFILRRNSVLPSSIDIFLPLVSNTGAGVFGVVVSGAAVLGTPWILGLLFRVNARYRRSAADLQLSVASATAAQETARLRTRQTELARDVHDVVGHSLAVVIAQAEAALATIGDQAAAAQALRNISSVARVSLAEVRQVLTNTDNPSLPPTRGGGTANLIQQVRSAGTDVTERTEGTPVDLAPESYDALYRVLQEMLTNAIKHGLATCPIVVDHRWEPDIYTVSVTNRVPRPPPPREQKCPRDQVDRTVTEGMGLRGIRARLQEIGATLNLGRTNGDMPTFTASADLPLHTGRPA